MNSTPALEFKIATEDWEFELIHQLNYKTFVEEIPQHGAATERRLVDKFHAENTYPICLCDGRLVGMLAMRGHRPFSLDQKLAQLDSYLPKDRRAPCEIRLLAIEKEFRGGQILQGLLALVWQHGIEKGYDVALISGTTRQLKLYRHLGFIPFGPLVGSGDAVFQPMYITLETFESAAVEFLRPTRTVPPTPANFLPGPVSVHKQVREAFEQLPESHRGEDFAKTFCETKQLLTDLAGSRQVEIFLGSGTLANDVVAAQLSLLRKRGLVLSNGEFGDRLIDHAKRAGLHFATLTAAWGETLDLGAFERALEASPETGWVWLTHCETSTGVLNDLAAIKKICATRKIKLCVDCISSLGMVPVDLDGIYLATSVSGKALASYPGLSMVFYHHELGPSNGQLPRYLDLNYYAANDGVPFTHSSNLVHALHAALKRVNWPRRFEALAQTSQWLRLRLAADGFVVLTPEAPAIPVATIVVPPHGNSGALGDLLRNEGYLLSYSSDYLRRRNWVQVCLMGEHTREKIVRALRLLRKYCPPAPAPTAADCTIEPSHRPVRRSDV